MSVSVWNQHIRRALTAIRPALNACVYSSHSFRSGASTALVERGASLDDARQLLNHRSEKAVAHYVKSNLELRRKLVGSML